ncbi:MAG: hypothetical protein ABSB67_00850 [Bryobacteraceae bacterium]|jgi:hypothetical protein
MSLISLRRYLDMARGDPSAESPSNNCLPFCQSLLKAIEARARSGPRDESSSGEEDLAQEWAGLLSAWSQSDRVAGCPDFTARALELAERENKLVLESSRRQAADMQSILTMLNDTLVGFSTGSERSVERLHRVQESLTRAAQLDDIVSLKATVGETLRLIRDETRREREESTKAVAQLQDRFVWARETILRQAPGLPGREAALEAVEMLRQGTNAMDLAVVAARLERIQALSGRFSPAVSEEAIVAFAHHEAAEAYQGHVYRWAPDTVLWVVKIPTDIERLRASLADRLREPHEYHGVANGRKVLFLLPIRWMCLTITEHAINGLAEQIDRLSGGLVRV